MPKKESQRLDVLLVERGLVESRTRAQALILAGKVLVDGRPVAKAGERVSPEAGLTLRQADHPYVSRGGVKLAGALDDFGLDVTGLVALDIGASTGGFTDCLLQRKAARVYALDVGRGQLDWKLRQDKRVIILEGINARYLKAEQLPEPVDLVVIDVSFISLRHILGPAAVVLRPGGRMVALVKPQFELEKKLVGKGGIVRDAELRARAVDQVAEYATRAGLEVAGRAESKLAGADGNQESFLFLRKPQE